MTVTQKPRSEAVGERVLRKVTWRLMPLLIGMYLMSFIDRVNIGVAALTMNADLGLTMTMYGFASGIFFLGYLLFQVPSNWMFHRVGMRRWMTVLLIVWGCCSAAGALVIGPHSLYAQRLVLGVAEAGFYPAAICYLGHWFPARERARKVALFLLAIPLANTIGAPLSALLVEHAGLGGLPGWRTMFLAEGLPTVGLGLLVAKVLPNTPREARWLTSAEQAWLIGQLADDTPTQPTSDRHIRRPFAAALTDPRVLVLALVNAGLYFGLYSLQFFLPSLIKGLRPGSSISSVGWLVAVCYAVSALAMMGWSRHSDRAAERTRHLVVPALAGAAVLVAAVAAGSGQLLLVGVTVTAACVFAALPVFWSLPATFLSGAAAAAGIAAINAISSLASFLGPYATGALKDATGSFTPSLLLLAASLALTGAVVPVAAILIRRTALR